MACQQNGMGEKQSSAHRDFRRKKQENDTTKFAKCKTILKINGLSTHFANLQQPGNQCFKKVKLWLVQFSLIVTLTVSTRIR